MSDPEKTNSIRILDPQLKCEWRAQTPRYCQLARRISSSSNRKGKTSKRSSLLEEWISMGNHTAEYLWQDETGTNLNPNPRSLRPSQEDNTVCWCFILRTRRIPITRREWNQETNSLCIKIHDQCRGAYAQIAIEALATTWVCEKFNDYTLGKEILIETDHKPLVPLFGSKSFDELLTRIKRFRIRLTKYSFTKCHIPGKELVVINTLSRTPLRKPPTR